MGSILTESPTIDELMLNSYDLSEEKSNNQNFIKTKQRENCLLLHNDYSIESVEILD